MTKNVKVVETSRGFALQQGSKKYQSTRVLHELAALLELVGAEHVNWRFTGNLEDPETLDAATELIQEVGAARKRLQRLLVPKASGTPGQFLPAAA